MPTERSSTRRALIALIITFALASSVAAFAPRGRVHNGANEMQEYVISGFHAWSVAKNSGFIFQPLPTGSGQRVTGPRDGVVGAFTVLGWPLSAQYLRTGPPPEVNATEEHVVAGFDAWAVARGSGFIFQPLIHAEGQWVTEPRDGVNTQLLVRMRTAQGREETVALARVAAGSASVNRPPDGSRTIGFEFFVDRQLARRWAIVRVDILGSFTWDRPVQPGSRDMSFRVTASSTPTSTGNAVVRSIVLRGPVGANWQDAFDSSTTKR